MTALRAALVTPLSGPLALYGVAGAAALHLWADQAAWLPPPWTGVDLEVFDAHPAPANAMREAVRHRPDVVFGRYGSGPALAALAATDRLVWNHGGAINRLRWSRFGRAVNVPAPAASYFAGVLQAVYVADAAVHTVSLLHVATGLGREVAGGLSCGRSRSPPGHGGRVAEQLPPGDVLLVAGPFLDELAAPPDMHFRQ